MTLKKDMEFTKSTYKVKYTEWKYPVERYDQNKNLMPYAAEPVTFDTEGPIEVIGPKVVSLSGGMTGTYIRTTGQAGEAALYIRSQRMKEVKITFKIETAE